MKEPEPNTVTRQLDQTELRRQMEAGDVDIQLAVAYMIADENGVVALEDSTWFDELAGKATVPTEYVRSTASARFLEALESEDGRSYKVALQMPVDFPPGSKKPNRYEEVTLQPPIGRHVLEASKAGDEGTMEFEFALIASQASVHPDMLALLHFADLNTLRFLARTMRGNPPGHSASTPS